MALPVITFLVLCLFPERIRPARATGGDRHPALGRSAMRAPAASGLCSTGPLGTGAGRHLRGGRGDDQAAAFRAGADAAVGLARAASTLMEAPLRFREHGWRGDRRGLCGLAPSLPAIFPVRGFAVCQRGIPALSRAARWTSSRIGHKPCCSGSDDGDGCRRATPAALGRQRFRCCRPSGFSPSS